MCINLVSANLWLFSFVLKCPHLSICSTGKISLKATVPGVVVFSNGSLLLPSTAGDDSGNYTCTASNVMGNVSVVAEVTVEGK